MLTFFSSKYSTVQYSTAQYRRSPAPGNEAVLFPAMLPAAAFSSGEGSHPVDISHSPAVTSPGIDYGISKQNNIPYNVSAKLGRHPELRSIKQPELIRTALEAP